MVMAAFRPSTYWRSALAAAALLAVGGLVVLILLERHDTEGDARREAVAGYISNVNRTQQALVLELDRVSTAYRKLRLVAKPDPRQVARLEAAEATLQTLRRRFASVVAPPEAAKLRTKLLELLDLQIAVAREVAGIARYLPLQAAENRRLAAATGRLRLTLDKSSTVAGQRAAFRAYRADLLDVGSALEGLAAPQVLEPTRRAQIARVERLATLAQQFAAALKRQDAREIDRVYRLFVQTSGTTGATRAERAAVTAFNRRLTAIVEQRSAVNAERNRIDRVLR
jgi:hypothetical protein